MVSARSFRLALAGVALFTLPGRAVAPEPRQRIVLITVDTLRYDAFAGSEKRPSVMPRVATRAAKGTRFERAHAATPTTQPTHASMFTGLHPWQHGVTRNGIVLGDSHETVAERLFRAGWETAAIVASFPLHRTFGLSQGFGLYYDNFDVPMGGRRSFGGVALGKNGFWSRANAITDRALLALDNLQGERQLLWVHYFDPHAPYGSSTNEELQLPDLLGRVAARDPAAREHVRRARELYDRDVAYLDEAVDRLLERILADAERVETHVLFTADHGESFGEGGSVGHETRLTPEQIHVPLFVISPRVAAGTRSDVTGSIDVAATLLGFAGIADDEGGGRDLALPAPGAAFGMRRSYAEPQTRPNLDGPPEVLNRRNRFYAVVNGTIYAGNAERVMREDSRDDEAPSEVSEQLEPLFARFSVSLLESNARGKLDAESQEALEALSYPR